MPPTPLMLNRYLIFKNTTWLILSQLTSQILAFITSIKIANYLGVELYGVYSFAFYFTALFGFSLDLGFNFSSFREISSNAGFFRKHYLTTFLIKLLVSILMLWAFYLVASLMELKTITFKTLLLAFVILIFTSFNVYAAQIYKAFERMHIEAVITIVSKFLILIGVVWAVLNNDLGIYPIFYVMIGVCMLAFAGHQLLLTGIERSIWSFKKVNLDSWRELLKISLPLLFFGMLVKIYFQIDFTMLKLMKGNYDVGIYAVAFKLISAIIIIPAAFVNALFPSLSKIKEMNQFKRVIDKAFKYLLLFAIPFGCGTFMLADEIIGFFYNEEFARSAVCLKILVWALVLMFGNWITGHALFCLRKDVTMIGIVSITVILNILANSILIPRWSYVGASLGTVLSEIVIMVLELAFLFKYIGYRPHIFPIIKVIMCSLIMTGVIGILQTHVHFIFNALIGGVVFCVLALVARIVTMDELKLMKHRNQAAV